jgi:hypothetical protein
MSPLPADLLIPVCITTAGVTRVLIEFIRARTTKLALREALQDARPEDRPAIVIALAQLLTGTRPASLGNSSAPARSSVSESRSRRKPSSRQASMTYRAGEPFGSGRPNHRQKSHFPQQGRSMNAASGSAPRTAGGAASEGSPLPPAIHPRSRER